MTTSVRYGKITIRKRKQVFFRKLMSPSDNKFRQKVLPKTELLFKISPIVTLSENKDKQTITQSRTINADYLFAIETGNYIE